jgi:hypothetical protein
MTVVRRENENGENDEEDFAVVAQKGAKGPDELRPRRASGGFLQREGSIKRKGEDSEESSPSR